MEELVAKYHKIFKENESFLNTSFKNAESIRKKAFEKFLKVGFPAKKDENYKYTHIAHEFNNANKFDLKESNFNYDLDDVFHCDVPNLHTDTITLINGKYAEKEKLTKYDNGLIIGSLKEASEKLPEIFQKYLCI